MKKRTYIWLYLVAIIFMGSCESVVEDLNIDPNNPTSAPADKVLTATEVANILVHEGEIARKAGFWSGYFTGEDRQYEAFNEYTVTSGDFDASWADIYVNVIRNARVARSEEISGKTDILIAISKVLEAHGASTAADLWGNVPFTEVGVIGNNTPNYESQQDIFQMLQDLLEEAISELENGTIRPSSGSEIHFDGDPNIWSEVAHTLKARIYMHTKDYEAAYAEAQLGISNAENSLRAVHSDAQDAQNLYYQLMTGNRGQDISSDGAFILDLLSENEGDYRGNEKTDERARFNYYFVTEDNLVKPNYIDEDGFAALDAPFPLISYEENQLILAEAGVRTQGFETGLDHLNNYREYLNDGGYISESFHEDGLMYAPYTSEDFSSGGIENLNGNVSADQALLREILEERYITFFGQIEGFNDLRRTREENSVKVPVTPTTGNELPQRFLYPQSEIERNPNIPGTIPGFFEPTPVNQ